MFEKSSLKNKRIVFLIDTDIQLLNALYFVLSNDLGGKTDAIIQMKSRNGEKRIDSLKRSGVFKNIYSLKLDKHYFAEKIEILIALFQPNLYMRLKHRIRLKRRYDTVFLAFATKTFDFVIAAIKPKKVYGYDDGMGSYIGDPFRDNYKKGYLKARKLLRREYNVNEVFLNNPLCFNGTNTVNVYPLRETLSEEDDRLINEVFDYKPHEGIEHAKYYFLNQAITDIDDYIGIERSLVDKLDRISGGDYILRFHPSERRRDIYSAYKDKIDIRNNMWELSCKNISDNNVLIGTFSSAQFSPKLLYNKEPYLIFTFKVFEGLDSRKKILFEQYVDFFRNKYENKGKVLVPNTIEEYAYFLQNTNK